MLKNPRRAPHHTFWEYGGFMLLHSYLLSLKDVTVIMVSHDSNTLEKCCSNILRINHLKLES